jgi:hypothetical protein
MRHRPSREDREAMSHYTAGQEVLLSGGPRSGERAVLDPDQAKLRYIAYGHPAVTGAGKPSKTPVFDRALGVPTPEPSTGYYRPLATNYHVWTWTEPRLTHRSVTPF